MIQKKNAKAVDSSERHKRKRSSEEQKEKGSAIAEIRGGRKTINREEGEGGGK